MSTLLADELYPGVLFEQTVRFERGVNISVIRPWIYKQGTLVDGDLQLEILQGAVVLSTKTINFSDINAALTETYAHGYIKFEFDSLQLNVASGNSEEDYIFRFSMINHTRDTTNFVAIVREWDVKKYPTYGAGVINGQAQNDSIEPAGLEIYTYRST